MSSDMGSVPDLNKQERQTGNCFCFYRPRSHLSQVCWRLSWNLPQQYSITAYSTDDTEVAIHTGKNSDIIGSASGIIFSINNFTRSIHRKAALVSKQHDASSTYHILSYPAQVVISDGSN